MTHDATNLTKDEFQTLISPFETSPWWERTGSSDEPEEAIARATDEQGVGELFYEHRNTEAHLHIQIPDEEEYGALKAVLDHPLDPAITHQRGEDSFTTMLSEAHHSIAERHRTVCITPVVDAEIIAKVHVPIPYDGQILGETVEALHAIAEEVGQLHRNVLAAVEDHTQDGPSADRNNTE